MPVLFTDAIEKAREAKRLLHLCGIECCNGLGFDEIRDWEIHYSNVQLYSGIKKMSNITGTDPEFRPEYYAESKVDKSRCYRSCGCLSRDTAKERGTTHGDSKIRLYRIWAGIIQRCCNDRERYEWEKYGGRGINVCKEWHKYEAFRDWALSNGYSDELTIDRIDVNGDYCPNNCRWATIYEQNNNKRTSKYISFDGKTGTVREFADKYGLAYSCLYARLKLGWSIEDALLTPSMKEVSV